MRNRGLGIILAVVVAVAVFGLGVAVGYTTEAWKAAHPAESSSAKPGAPSTAEGADDSDSSADGGSDASGTSDSSAAKAMFQEVAGEYSWPSSAISRTDLTLRSDGTFNAAYTVAKDQNAAHLNYDTPSTTVDITGRFSSIAKTDTGYTLQCDAKTLKTEDGGTTADQKASGMAPCGTWRWYSGGTTLGDIRDETGAWGAGGFDADRQAVALASDHGSGALFLRMS